MPQLFQIMPCRVQGYKAALEGFNISDTYLVSYNDICINGNNIFSPSGYTDHVGSYLYIPFLSNLFSTTIENTAVLFFSLYGLFCILLSLIGLFYFYNSKFAKILILGATFSPIGETYKENPDRNSKQDTIEKMPEKMGSNKAEFTSNYIDTSKKD